MHVNECLSKQHKCTPYTQCYSKVGPHEEKASITPHSGVSLNLVSRRGRYDIRQDWASLKPMRLLPVDHTFPWQFWVTFILLCIERAKSKPKNPNPMYDKYPTVGFVAKANHESFNHFVL